jgi:arsenate reductase (thioredoxin)
MRELGIDLSDRIPQGLTVELAQQAHVVVTMGCCDACPYIPGKRYIDWNLADPKGRPLWSSPAMWRISSMLRLRRPSQ